MESYEKLLIFHGALLGLSCLDLTKYAQQHKGEKS